MFQPNDPKHTGIVSSRTSSYATYVPAVPDLGQTTEAQCQFSYDALYLGPAGGRLGRPTGSMAIIAHEIQDQIKY